MALSQYFNKNKEEIDSILAKTKETIEYLDNIGIKREWLTEEEFELIRDNVDSLSDKNSEEGDSKLWFLFIPEQKFDFKQYSDNSLYSDLISHISLLVKNDSDINMNMSLNQILKEAFKIRYERKAITREIPLYANLLFHILQQTRPLARTSTLVGLRHPVS